MTGVFLHDELFKTLFQSFCMSFVPGQGQFRQQLCFDLMQLRDKEEDDDGSENGDRQGNEPVTSHGMRPARGWASFNILPV